MMKSLPWIIAGVGIGIAGYVILNQPGPQYATGSDTLEGAAGDTSLWGSKQRLKGAGGGLVGKVKEGVGSVTGDQELESEGVGDQMLGEVKDTVGHAAQALGQTIHDINK